MRSRACLPGLPIAAAEEEIADLISNHQVVVVAGATGSGKTTQLPKICLSVGRRRIVHTQPRRIAARSVAERIAEELGTNLGDVVGYQVRFTKAASRATKVKVVTDGILLAELGVDRDLRGYDTIIVDEAHERSLNIDFLLGYLKQLLPRRPDLKVIITSATIDTERFSAHFDGAPIVEIPGRTYPVDVLYRPIADEADPMVALKAAVEELWTRLDGDILVFFSGEREIRDAAEALAGLDLPRTEIMPLFARLSLSEQQKVFSAHEGTRIVLATNVAETSVTVPGIRAVIDFGTARVSRYSTRAKVQRLPIEEVSQASANQRAGRCGRLGPGVCIRLYSEENFFARPEFTEPEILRTNLAAIILQMAWARLGDIEVFPFVDPPDRANIRDGIRLLRELGALTDSRRLTKTGRLMARMPIDPVLSRMLVEGDRRGCLREVQAIVAGLAIVDVRERPTGLEAEADLSHRRFWVPLDNEAKADDVTALLQLWRYLRDQRRALSGSAFRRMCRDEYLNFLRAREWQDLNAQLKDVCRDLGLKRNRNPGQVQDIQTAVLAGLLSHVGALFELPGRGRRIREYLGARGIRFAIQPGSALAGSPPELVMAVELVETTRLWARTCAAVTPEQIEEVGGHLLKRSYFEPHWSERAGQAVAREKVLLLGVPIVADRLVSLGRIDPPLARKLFIRSALVEGRWRTRHRFWERNQREISKVQELGNRARKDVLVGDDELFAFYSAKIPDEVVSVTHFDRWWRDKRREDGQFLDLSPEQLLAESDAVAVADYPDVWTVGGHDLDVHYTFDPGSGSDGVSVDVPLTVISRISDSALTWQVPGLRHELATELIRALPKELRTQLVPAPQAAQDALDWVEKQGIDPEKTRFWSALSAGLGAVRGVSVPESAWDVSRVPGHLRLTVVSGGKTDVSAEALAERLRAKVSSALAQSHEAFVQPAAKNWSFGQIVVATPTEPVAFPALRDCGDSVSVAVFPTLRLADRSHALGLRRLLDLTIADSTMWVVSRLDNWTKLALAASPYKSVPDLLRDARLAAISGLLESLQASAPRIRTEAGFQNLRDNLRPRLAEQHLALVQLSAQILTKWQEARLAVDRLGQHVSMADLRGQLSDLVFPGFLSSTCPERLRELPRYLSGVAVRVDGIESNPGRDAALAAEVVDLLDDYDAVCANYPIGELPEDLERVGWLIEELRISLFAQRLGVKERVSVKRVRARLAV